MASPLNPPVRWVNLANTTTKAVSATSSNASASINTIQSFSRSSAAGPLVADFNSTVNVNGLELSLSINATRLTVGQSIWANVSLYNTLPQANSIAASDDWALQGIAISFWPDCNPVNDSLVGAAQAVVLQGFYTIANISRVANSTVSGGTCHEPSPVNHVIFLPSSSRVDLVSYCCGLAKEPVNQTSGPYSLSTSFTTNGYWDLGANSQLLEPPEVYSNPSELNSNQSPVATSFVPGTYTIAVADCWGQAVILHFEVTG